MNLNIEELIKHAGGDVTIEQIRIAWDLPIANEDELRQNLVKKDSYKELFVLWKQTPKYSRIGKDVLEKLTFVIHAELEKTTSVRDLIELLGSTPDNSPIESTVAQKAAESAETIKEYIEIYSVLAPENSEAAKKVITLATAAVKNVDEARVLYQATASGTLEELMALRKYAEFFVTEEVATGT